MRILVFGGSFDPPHLGHAALLSAAARAVKPGRILIVPAYQAPLKDRPATGASERLAMIRLGLLRALPARWRRAARIDHGELRLKRRVYTIDTLKRLAKSHPGAELHFAVGSDAAASFDSWKEPARLRRMCRWWSARRSKNSRAIPAFFKRLPGRMPEISSTELRELLASGEDVSASLAPAVRAYIGRRGLYGTGLLRSLEGLLPPDRMAHTLAVTRLAEKLARRWGEDPAKARLAALLHDCGRALSGPSMKSYARRRRLKVPALKEIIRRRPLLLHAYIGADLARRRFGVTDPAVLSAIRKHTLGGREMSRLDRLLYVADAASEDRGHPGAKALRQKAFRDLGGAFRDCVRDKLGHARASSSWIHPTTLSLWNSLRR